MSSRCSRPAVPGEPRAEPARSAARRRRRADAGAAGRGLAAWLVRWRLALRLARRDARRRQGPDGARAAHGRPAGDGDRRRRHALPDQRRHRGRVAAVRPRRRRRRASQGVAREQIYADPSGAAPARTPTEPTRRGRRRGGGTLLPAGARVVERQVGALAFRTGIGYAYASTATPTTCADRSATAPSTSSTAECRRTARWRSARRSPRAASRSATRSRSPGTTSRSTVVGVLRSTVGGRRPFLVVAPGGGRAAPGPPDFFASRPGRIGLARRPGAQRRGPGRRLAGGRARTRRRRRDTLPPGWPADDSGLGGGAVAVVALDRRRAAARGRAAGRARRSRSACGGSAATWRCSPRAAERRPTCAGPCWPPASAGRRRSASLGALLGIGLAASRRAACSRRGRRTASARSRSRRSTCVVVVARRCPGRPRGGVRAGPAGRAHRRRRPRSPGGGGRCAARGGCPWSAWSSRRPVWCSTVLGARGTELAVAGGAVLLVVGLVLATPWLVGLLAPLARRLPVAGRLAVRDATRNRTRTAPAVAAVMATVAGITTLAIGSASDSAQGQRDYVPQLADGHRRHQRVRRRPGGAGRRRRGGRAAGARPGR